MDKIIEVKNLNKIFRIDKSGIFSFINGNKEIEKVHALKDINLEIKSGEFVALLGPNGAGKSTLIKALIGVLAYDSGTVKVYGKEPLDNRRFIISKAGVVFGQRSRLWHDLPVKQSFDLTKRLYLKNYPREYTAKQEEWENILMDRIEIKHLLNRQVKKLSLGEKMRCELVNTLLYNPDILFLDEPTIGLDVVSKNKIRETLKILSDKGKTIILTSHDTVDVEKLCERVIVINDGEIKVDLSMSDFMKLNDEAVIYVKSNNKLSESDLDEFNYEEISDYELRLCCKKSEVRKMVKFLFNNLDVIDISINSEDVESILVDLYTRK